MSSPASSPDPELKACGIEAGASAPAPGGADELVRVCRPGGTIGLLS